MGLTGHLPELIVLLVAALVIFGPKRLPEIGNAMGKGIKEFKRGQSASDEEEVKTTVVQPQLSSHVEPVAPATRAVEPVGHTTETVRDREVG